MNRRDLCIALPALGVLRSLVAVSQTPVPSVPVGPIAKTQNSLQTDFGHCMAFPFEKLPLRYSDGGAPTHDILRGTVPTGELVELHETTVQPGMMPHAAHQHPHEELILVREGTIDFLYGGESHRLTPGSVGYTAPNEMHGFENAGTVPATYFIFSLSKK